MLMLLCAGDNTGQWECFSSHNPYSARGEAVWQSGWLFHSSHDPHHYPREVSLSECRECGAVFVLILRTGSGWDRTEQFDQLDFERHMEEREAEENRTTLNTGIKQSSPQDLLEENLFFFLKRKKNHTLTITLVRVWYI